VADTCEHCGTTLDAGGWHAEPDWSQNSTAMLYHDEMRCRDTLKAKLAASRFALEEAARSLLTAAEWRRADDESPTAALQDLRAWARSRAHVAKAALDAETKAKAAT